jgi:hypothetical protein
MAVLKIKDANGTIHEILAIRGKDGINGTNGANGKSAYDLAVEQGFEGSVDEWLNSLVGVDGKDGINGTDGKDGADGKDYVLTDADKQEIADLVSGGGNADLSNYYTKSEVNNLKVSAFTNDAGYLTEAQVLALIQANMPINGDGESY